MNVSRFLWALLLPLLATTGSVSAQTTAESRMEKLEETVRVLERRVANLEEQLRQRSASSPVAADKANWRKLQRGMSEGEVEKLLGSPSKVDVYGSFAIWRFGEPFGGQVQFDGGRLSSWREP